MTILDIIEKKRVGEPLNRDELDFAFLGYLNGKVEDYQMSSLLMAICINGMNLDETVDLTDIMLNSGTKVDTTKVDGIMVDKHSTGGVGDKTSLIIGPIMASLGLKMGKLSGRGLGHTGGTIDKLESIPGFRVAITKEEFINNMNTVGFTECEQTPEFTPLDKMIYELRSVTGTVSSIPLIASSIMSKKLAVGADYILIDLKIGDGALIKNKKDAVELASMMIDIGSKYNKTVIPVLTDMNTPLGDNVGNALEVLEVLDVLKGKNGMLRDLCIQLASTLYSRCKGVNIDVATKEVKRVLDNGNAYDKFIEFVNNQGGNIDNIELAKNLVQVKSPVKGEVKDISALKIGNLSLNLGGGRIKKGAKIDYSVGVVLNKHIGSKVEEGDILCYLYQSDSIDRTKDAIDAFTIVK